MTPPLLWCDREGDTDQYAPLHDAVQKETKRLFLTCHCFTSTLYRTVFMYNEGLTAVVDVFIQLSVIGLNKLIT